MSRPLSSAVSLDLGFSFNTALANNLTYIRNMVRYQDIDGAILVDGAEGAGKSVLGMQIGYFLDVERYIDVKTQICWTPEQFKNAVKTLPKFKAIIWDEARRGLNRRRSVKNVNLEMTDMLAECRQRNLYLVIIMPSFYDMDMNVAVWRSLALIHVWYRINAENIDRPLQRGFFRFYSQEGKQALYTNKLLRQAYKYPYIPNESTDGSFCNHYVVDETEYRRLKAESITAQPASKTLTRDLADHRRSCVGLFTHLQKLKLLRVGASNATAKYLGFETKNAMSVMRRYKTDDVEVDSPEWMFQNEGMNEDKSEKIDENFSEA